MRCLFCKQDSSNTKSIEHIIPESLGNKTMVLPRGYVCDKRNNYFAIKVEKTFLELPEIRQLRFYEMIPNKKNKMPRLEGFFNGKPSVELGWDQKQNLLCVYAKEEVMNKIIKKGQGEIIFPIYTNKTMINSNIIVSRLLAKMALEAFADRLKTLDGSLEELVDYKEFDKIRNHARRGTTSEWPCSIRRIYDMDRLWKCEGGKEKQKVYESGFLTIDKGGNGNIKNVILYFIVVLWGMEFVINMGEPEINGYTDWVNQHQGLSPLYVNDI